MVAFHWSVAKAVLHKLMLKQTDRQYADRTVLTMLFLRLYRFTLFVLYVCVWMTFARGQAVDNKDHCNTFPDETLSVPKGQKGIRIENSIELSTNKTATVDGIEVHVYGRNKSATRLISSVFVNSSGVPIPNEDMIDDFRLRNTSITLKSNVTYNSILHLFEVRSVFELRHNETTLYQHYYRISKVVVVVISHDKNGNECRNDKTYTIKYTRTAGTSGTGSTVPAHKPTSSIGTGSTVPASNPTASTGEAKVDEESIPEKTIIAVSCVVFGVLVVIIIYICVIRRRRGPSTATETAFQLA